MKSETRIHFIIHRKNVQQLSILYGCALFYTVFLTPNRYRGDENAHINFVPLINTISAFSEQGNEHFWPYYIGYWGNIFGNMFLFFPFGFLYKCLYPNKEFSIIAGYGLLLSVSIELTQLILRIGVCDIDDVIFNFVGTVAGIYLYYWIRKKVPEWFKNL